MNNNVKEMQKTTSNKHKIRDIEETTKKVLGPEIGMGVA